MAFCTNCGKSLEEGARFCTNCGTSVQPAASAPVRVPSATAAAAPAVAAEPPVPATETSEVQPEVAAAPVTPVHDASPTAPYAEFSAAPQTSTSPIFLIVCIVLILLIAGGIGGTVYLQRQGKAKATAAQQSPSDSSQPSQTPSSNSSSSRANPAPVSSPGTSSPSPVTSEPTPAAVPVTPAPVPSRPPVADSIRAMNLGNYPGASPVGIATLTGETVVAGFLTRDTPRQVVQFYKIRFPVSTTTESEGGAELSATLPGGERIRIQAVPQGTNTQVMVLQEN